DVAHGQKPRTIGKASPPAGAVTYTPTHASWPLASCFTCSAAQASQSARRDSSNALSAARGRCTHPLPDQTSSANANFTLKRNTVASPSLVWSASCDFLSTPTSTGVPVELNSCWSCCVSVASGWTNSSPFSAPESVCRADSSMAIETTLPNASGGSVGEARSWYVAARTRLLRSGAFTSSMTVRAWFVAPPFRQSVTESWATIVSVPLMGLLTAFTTHS